MTCFHCGHNRETGNYCPQCGRVDLDALRSVQVSPSATPSRKNSVPPSRPNNSFERGVRKDDRGIPYLDSNGKPLRLKEKFDRKLYAKAERPSVTLSTGGN